MTCRSVRLADQFGAAIACRSSMLLMRRTLQRRSWRTCFVVPARLAKPAIQGRLHQRDSEIRCRAAGTAADHLGHRGRNAVPVHRPTGRRGPGVLMSSEEKRHVLISTSLQWRRSAISSLRRICVAGCFWLAATASPSGTANAAGIDMSDIDAAAAAGPQPSQPAQDNSIAQTGQPPSGNPLWAITLEQLSATRDRPIFSPSRRPPPAAVPVTAVASPSVQAPKRPERPQLSLVGTIMSGDDGFAIFVDQTTKTPLRIRIGGAHQGWMLRQVEARSATLQNGEEVAVLTLSEPANDPNTAAGAGSAKTSPDLPAPPPPLASTTPPYLSPESNALRKPARPRGSSARRRP